MLVNLVSCLPVPSLNILSVIILVQIINLSRRGCNKELVVLNSSHLGSLYNWENTDIDTDCTEIDSRREPADIIIYFLKYL